MIRRLDLFRTADIFPAWRGVESLEEKSLRQPILHFIGVAVDVGSVEARNLVEVADPGDIAIIDFRLQGVAEGDSEMIRQVGAVEVALQHRRQNLQVGFDSGAIDGSIHRSRDSIFARQCVGGRRWLVRRHGAEHLAVRITGLAYPEGRTNCPSIGNPRSRDMGKQIEAADVVGLIIWFRSGQKSKAGFAARQDSRCAQVMVHSVEFDPRQMKNSYLVARCVAGELLISLRIETAGETIFFMRHKSPGLHFRCDRQAIVLREDLAVDV